MLQYIHQSCQRAGMVYNLSLLVWEQALGASGVDVMTLSGDSCQFSCSASLYCRETASPAFPGSSIFIMLCDSYLYKILIFPQAQAQSTQSDCQLTCADIIGHVSEDGEQSEDVEPNYSSL